MTGRHPPARADGTLKAVIMLKRKERGTRFRRGALCLVLSSVACLVARSAFLCFATWRAFLCDLTPPLLRVSSGHTLLSLQDKPSCPLVVPLPRVGSVIGAK